MDNVAKIILDALSRLAWKDDAQVVKADKEKRFGDPPRVFVGIRLEEF